MSKHFIFGAFAALFLFLPLHSAKAQDGMSLSDVAKVELLPGWRTPKGTHMAGLRITLAKGWKTYWRSPGDAGIPPQFDWSGSENLGSVALHWPTPSVFVLNGMQTLAYEDEVVIPVEFTTGQNSNGAIKLNGRMNFGVCEEICVPISVQISADLANAGRPDATINRALGKRPIAAKLAGVGNVSCSIAPISDGMRLAASIQVASLGGKEVAVVELADQTIWVSEAETERNAGQLSAIVEMVPANGQPFALARSDIRFTIIGSERAIDIQGCSAG